MITYEEAIRIIDEAAKPMAAEQLHIGAARGRFLAEDVIARYDSPPFDNSAVDGFGRRLDDLGKSPLRLARKIQAGGKGDGSVGKGQAVQIFTGAPIPADIAAVSMQEDCEVSGTDVQFDEPSRPGDHIRRAGSDFRAGETVLRKGDRLSPAQMGIAISAGVRQVSVVGIPEVSLLTSGSELLDISHELMPWKIYNSNGYSLSSAVHEIHHEWESTTASDKPEVLRKRMMETGMTGDVVITSGGVSVGEFDLMKEEFAFWKVKERFWRVAIKPGKPVYFGTQGNKLVFGLPGNPVSALVTYLLFARPAILKRMGNPDPWPKPVQARFDGESRKKAGRMEFLRGVLSFDGSVREAGEQGSHQLAALAAANCLIHFPLEAEKLHAGDTVEVTPIQWGVT